MKNVAIRLDEETASWVQAVASARNVSISRLVREIVREWMSRSREYEEAKHRFLSKAPVRLKGEGQQYASREDAHE